MTDNDRQAAWNAFMERLVPVAYDPQSVLGTPRYSRPHSNDFERTWLQTTWQCSIVDQVLKRTIQWAHTDTLLTHCLVARLASDGAVEQLTLLYRQANHKAIVIGYADGQAKPATLPGVVSSLTELPSKALIREITQAIPLAMLP